MRESRAEFGKELARLRTEKGVSLEDLAAATKVRSELLRSLESGRFDALPPAVFVEGYLKACANHLGADPRPLLARYRTLTSGESEAAKAVPAPVLAPPLEEGRAGWRKWLVGFVLLAASGYAVFYLMNRMERSQVETAPQRSVRSASRPQAPEGAGAAAPAAAQEPSQAVQPPASVDTAGAQAPAVPAPAEPQAAPPAERAAPAAVPESVPGPAAGTQALAALPAGDLVLVASGPCWCEIWADGKRVLYRQVVSGDRIGLQGSKFKVSMGNVGAIELHYKGQKVPLPSEQGRVLKDLEIPSTGEVSIP